MKEHKPFAAEEHDITGYAAVDFLPESNFQMFAASFPGYTAERYQPVALRMFIEDGGPVFTLYAFDTQKSDTQVPDGKKAVRKFKSRMSFEEFMAQIKSFDFTLVARGFDLEAMWVENT